MPRLLRGSLPEFFFVFSGFPFEADFLEVISFGIFDGFRVGWYFDVENLPGALRRYLSGASAKAPHKYLESQGA